MVLLGVPEAETKPYQFRNAMPSYWEFLRSESPGDPAAATQRFAAMVVEPQREVFTAVAAGWLSDKNLGRLVTALESQTRQLRRAEKEFPERFARAWRRFAHQAPDLKPGAEVVLLPAPRNAVGGAVRPLKERALVAFGAEEIGGTLGSKTAFDVLVHHELTHLYHMQVNGEMRKMIAEVYLPPYAADGARLYQVLWLEGLAVYTSRLLNPSAPDKEVLLSDSVAAGVKALWPQLGADLRKHLDSARKEDIDAYLFDSDSSKGIPRRTGYFVGMLVAQHLAKRYKYAELCRLAGPQLRKEMERALQDLEKTGIDRQ
jgi:hypothetical protein